LSRKVVLIVMDSAGIGELPDADKYGDKGSDTLGSLFRLKRDFHIPNLINLGLGNITDVNIPVRSESPIGSFGKAAELSPGKDTTTGHWEIAGLVLEKPFPVYPEGFPDEVIVPFKEAIGRDILWNRPASGSEIINLLGDMHVQSGLPIIYTSADSVFQIAAHEEIIPLETLYQFCTAARGILQGDHAVGRVIARPFTGSKGKYERTKNRRDFSLPPFGPTILDIISNAGMITAGVGKIGDIFAGRGLSRIINAKTNKDGLNETIKLISEDFEGLIFTNLVDFDMHYGHRNDVQGYGDAMEALDRRIPELLAALADDDVLILTADHGCDPSTASTDHSREYIPILLYGHSIKKGINIGILDSFSDIGATVLDLLGIKGEHQINGKSFKEKIIQNIN
jgi:phosphopentomutase